MGPNDNPVQSGDAPVGGPMPQDGGQTPPAPTPMPVGGAEEPSEPVAGGEEMPGVPGTPPTDNPVTPVEPSV